MNLAAAIHLIPFSRDPADAAAELLLQVHRDALPDLSSVVVVPPPGPAAPRLRRALLARARAMGRDAVLGPHIEPLQRWLWRRHPPPMPTLSDGARELMLVEALQHHRGLFGETSPWAVAASLIALFDELTRCQAPLPADKADFENRLQAAYGTARGRPPPLMQEAALVHTLWQAWHEQLAAEGRADAPQVYVDTLAAAADADDAAWYLFVGQSSFLPAEWLFVRARLETGRAALLLHGKTAVHPLYAPGAPLAGTAAPPQADCAYSAFLDAVFHHTEQIVCRGETTDTAPLIDRTRAFAAGRPVSPAADRLCAFTAAGAEQEARAVELQVRRWLLEGRRDIGIVTGDRRLARRVRALLERAGVGLHDAAGWALSTTSAAAALERWLEAVEEDFHHQPLVDLLRSPFVLVDWDRKQLQEALFRLEQDIISHENVARGMARYRRALRSRRHRLGTVDAAGVEQLLNALAKAAEPLQPYLRGGPYAPARLLDALQVSLDRLGLTHGYGTDAAGEQVLEVLTALLRSLDGRRLRMNWPEFRQWLGRALEQAHFSPQATRSGVSLLALSQSALAHFDGVIVAGLDRRHLPGEDSGGPFFNQAVRRGLGLPSAVERHREAYYHFRRLLQAAPRVLLTVCSDHDGEPVVPSPWLAQLQAFHHLAYGGPLDDGGLAALLPGDRSLVVRSDGSPAPVPRSRPAPRIDPSLVPASVSASAHQHLIDCPYRYFALQCLGLSPPEAVSEKLAKSDYGERVHRILQAFHGGVAGLPGPFAGPLTGLNRPAAAALLQTISTAVFAEDLEDNFQHRGWLRRWQAQIEPYLDWQAAREAEGWRVTAVERRAEFEFPDTGVHLTGRLDRIDTGPAGLGIIDYKTGAVPAAADVHAGEVVQLPFYALLAQGPVARVEYLNLDRNGFGGGAGLGGDALAELRDATAQRLGVVMEALRAGSAMPAWGDEAACERCKASGVCRKQAWSL